MKLQKGITGFRSYNCDDVLPSIAEHQIKSSVYSIEYEGKFKIVAFQFPNAGNNFYRVKLHEVHRNNNFDLLFNRIYPYYCAVTNKSIEFGLEFVSLTNEIQKLIGSDFNYIDPDILNKRVSSVDITELNSAEIKQIEYWKSKSFGEIIFNGYD